MTQEIFEVWVRYHFIQKVDEYCKENNLSFKISWLVNNAPDHSTCEYNEKVKIMFLPPNTIFIIQPMDQGVIHTFKVITYGTHKQQLELLVERTANR